MPEKININYIIFEKDKLKDSIKIGDKDLLNFYNENKYKYVVPEKRNVSQIFLSNKKSSKDENKAKIVEISEKLTSNLNFSDLAEEYSNDELSKDKGGNIGWITSKDLSGELSNSIFSIANIGDVSKILETEQGFYIFKLIDIKDSKIKKFDDIKNNLRKDYKNIQISRKYEVLYEDLANILFENPNSLDKVEQYLSVKKISTGLLTLPQIKSQHKIFSDPKVLAVLSSPSVSNDNLNSEPIEIMDKIIMFRVSEKSKKEYKKYKEVENEILSLLKTEKSIENMKNSIKDIEEKVRKGKPLSEIEKMVNKKFTSYNSIERDDDSIPPSILDKVFSLNLKNNVTSIESGTGNYELIFLDSIGSGETDLSQKSINTMFNNDQVNSLLYAVIQSMRDKSNIKIYSENL